MLPTHLNKRKEAVQYILWVESVKSQNWLRLVTPSNSILADITSRGPGLIPCTCSLVNRGGITVLAVLLALSHYSPRQLGGFHLTSAPHKSDRQRKSICSLTSLMGYNTCLPIWRMFYTASSKIPCRYVYPKCMMSPSTEIAAQSLVTRRLNLVSALVEASLLGVGICGKRSANGSNMKS